MEKTNCWHLAMLLAFGKRVRFRLWTHDNATGAETLKEYETNGESPDIFVEEYSVMMFSADRKNQITIYGYREIN